MNLIYSAFVILVGLLTWMLFKPKRKQIPEGAYEVPIVEGRIPFAGNGIEFGKDIIAFVRKAYAKYGPIFRIKVFRSDIIVVCERSLMNEYFKITEDRMSLYDILDRLYFADAFSDKAESLPTIIKLVKSTITVKFDEFMPKILGEARSMINRLRETCLTAGESTATTIRLANEMIRFVAFTSARCFISQELDDRIYEEIIKFTNTVNFIVKLTYFFPKRLLRFFANPILSRYRHRIISYVTPEIQKYRADPLKNDSLVFRRAVDYIDADTGRKLTDHEIGEVVICLLYVSSENTALGLTNALTDLITHPTYWDRVKKETKGFLDTNDMKGLMACQILDACIMESARMTNHIFALQRRPRSKDAVLGNYYVGDADSVAYCGPMMMVHDSANDVYVNATEYNPDRFITGKQPKTSPNIITWGHGVHLCPGKMFAIYETKTAIALLLNTFDMEIPGNVLPPLDYFSPSAFAERKLNVILRLAKPEINSIDTSTEKPVSFTVDGKLVEYYEHENNAGWLIRDYFDKDLLFSLYTKAVALSHDSVEQKEIVDAPIDKAYPLTYYNLVYTGKSNCSEPVLWFTEAQAIWKFLHDHPALRFTGGKQNFNSFYCQLFGDHGAMAVHKDQYVSWGVSINIGASCDFMFGDKVILLHNGDVFVSDFSKVDHAVLKVHENTAPGWFSDDYIDESSGIQVRTFGRTRCSIQIREVHPIEENRVITTEEFKELVTGQKY